MQELKSLIQLTGKGVEITQILRDFIDQKISKLAKHAHHITHIHIVLCVEKLRQLAEIELHVPHNNICAKVESKDMYKTIDLLLDKAVKQLEKYSDRVIKNHRKNGEEE